MPTQLSPGVVSNEYNLTTIIPTVSTSTGALAGIFNWGPVLERTSIQSQAAYQASFGPPTNANPETWFTGFNFLSYGNSLVVVRGANTSGATPYLTAAATGANSTVSNNIFVLSSGNTNALVNGMYIAQSSNATIAAPSTNNVINVINSTAFSVLANTNANTNVTFYFGNPGTSYNALALQNAGQPVANLVNQVVSNSTFYHTVANGNFDSNVIWVAKYPSAMGNSLRIATCDSAAAFSSNVSLFGYANATSSQANSTTGNAYSAVFTPVLGSNTASLMIVGLDAISIATVAANLYTTFTTGDNILAGNSSIGYQYLSISGMSNGAANSTNFQVNFRFQVPYSLHTPYIVSNTVNGNSSVLQLTRYWEFYNSVGVAPGQSPWVRLNGNTAANDQMHVVIVDNLGQFTGTPGQILETYKNVSRAVDAQNLDSTDNYYADVINGASQYIWWANDRSGAATANAALVKSSTNTQPGNYPMILGTSGYTETQAPLSILGNAYNLFASKVDATIDLVMQGYPAGGSGATYQLANWLISNIALNRQDCVVFVSPDKVNVLNNYGQEAYSIINWASNIQSTSYAVIDSGYKYQYDDYNNVYRWIPLNGDIAGLCARTDQTNNAWWSPAGFNRGQINNIVKLAYNPRQTDRDNLFSAYINPVVTFPGQGTILYGDSTYLGQSSAFNRINVRRLFIVLERAISIAAQNYLFEFNDAFTRAQFVNMVSPYLRTIQGLRGITDFYVVCDTTNNTPQVIDNNQFIGSIYVKPARAIDFIQLNFIAVPTGVQFSSVVGSY